jgi:hypothetical protein
MTSGGRYRTMVEQQVRIAIGDAVTRQTVQGGPRV